ncbi:RAP protein, putative [Plasmodium knowlesi strain H]|uniref:RAP protein, putative n=3 Tax=Plasmodium knowlesi TaxID=5850 RepID=A0A5K1UNQ8_PLAKH|nr:heptatricopeptide repeat and RAP domain-containing protein, putative [Plasmodium knowlesi strain H]OTN64210.1 putative RAP protein [Plasmodium knowlesi]CAA9990849.1 heptatricopeptide repeat and RAP domain-containing protein, putative [Plasmodium knowlesi strain H]SBO20944.1 RAP protein, putative [Plasmodium knowlesi strain H]SBO21434.1 RAP protein, putative [Plasmodium knowlesi strain H]VVS80323.1 heptatricopeptide repeat and RAP domain-containing protein, putative [Plasmodium knowlesi stra|eukprot:XP_002262137.1 RAP protein, putative [Plasmodium knowlesi strain H]
MSVLQKGGLIASGARYIRTGKFKNPICYKQVVSEKKEEREKEVDKLRRNQIKFLELLHLNNLKMPQPKKWTKKKVPSGDYVNGKRGGGKGSHTNGDTNISTTEGSISSCAVEWGQSEKKCDRESGTYHRDTFTNRIKKKALLRRVMGNEGKLKKAQKEDSSNERNNVLINGNKTNCEGNEPSGILTQTHLHDSISNLLVDKKTTLKKKIHLINFSVTNSYVSKKYYIQVKNDPCEDRFSISELKSIGLFDELEMSNGRRDTQDMATSSAPSPPYAGDQAKGATDAHDSQIPSQSKKNKQEIMRKIYKASINHVRDENLWKKYVQNTFIISGYLDASEIVILFWCFGKIGYRDNRLINLLCSILLKKINDLTPCALALLLNSFKKLEIKKYDTVELLTNQFCLHIQRWTSQDIALVANSLAFFYIYHKVFWKKCILKLQNGYYFSHPLHLCLIISALARLDIREGNVLLSLSKGAKKYAKQFSPNNLALVIHSFAKLKFSHPKFYNYLYQFVHTYLDRQLFIGGSSDKNRPLKNGFQMRHNKRSEGEIRENMLQSEKNIASVNPYVHGINNFDEHPVGEYPHVDATKNCDSVSTMWNSQDGEAVVPLGSVPPGEGNEEDRYYDSRSSSSGGGNTPLRRKEKAHFDLQSLVLLLFSCTCLITCTENMILKLTYLILPLKDHLGSHKVEKLKYVSEYIQFTYPQIFANFPKEIKMFYNYIDTYEIKKKKKNMKYGARWINELSKILARINVNHLKNIYINHICADIMLPDSQVIIMCLGPYSYYVNSLVTTSTSDLKRFILEKKKYKVIPLSYHEWNKLNDYEEKIRFLYAFGRDAANYLFVNAKKGVAEGEKSDEAHLGTHTLGSADCGRSCESGGENAGEGEKWGLCNEPMHGPLYDTERQSKNYASETNEPNYTSDEDDEVIDFIKKGISVDDGNEEDSDRDKIEIEEIKKFLEVEKL